MVTKHDDIVFENWFLDTGCFNHMTGHKEWLTNLDTSKQSKVRLANDNTITIVGAGDIVIRGDGEKVTNIKTTSWERLLTCHEGWVAESLWHETEIGVEVSFVKEQSLSDQVSKQCFAATVLDKSDWIWHIRFGHLNFQSLKKLADNKMVIGLSNISLPDKMCEECLLGK